MGAYHASELQPTATAYPEVTRCCVATVKPSRLKYLKKRPRIAVFCPLCVPHHTKGSCCGECNSTLAAVHERNKQKKSFQKNGARAHTQTGRQTHPKQQRGQPQTPRPASTRRPRLGQRKVWSPHFSPIFIRVAFCSRHPLGGADAQSR